MASIRRKKPTLDDYPDAIRGVWYLKQALECYRNAPRTAARVRVALSSAKGAVRHAYHRTQQAAAAIGKED